MTVRPLGKWKTDRVFKLKSRNTLLTTQAKTPGGKGTFLRGTESILEIQELRLNTKVHTMYESTNHDEE